MKRLCLCLNPVTHMLVRRRGALRCQLLASFGGAEAETQRLLT